MKKILIIEDEAALRSVYDMILSSEGYDVATAVNGKEGLDRLASFRPDLVLLDILMPVMDGYTFLKHAEIIENHPGINVIVFSNLSDQEKLEEMKKLGVTDYALKASMSPKELIKKVQDIFGSYD